MTTRTRAITPPARRASGPPTAACTSWPAPCQPPDLPSPPTASSRYRGRPHGCCSHWLPPVGRCDRHHRAPPVQVLDQPHAFSAQLPSARPHDHDHDQPTKGTRCACSMSPQPTPGAYAPRAWSAPRRSVLTDRVGPWPGRPARLADPWVRAGEAGCPPPRAPWLCRVPCCRAGRGCLAGTVRRCRRAPRRWDKLIGCTGRLGRPGRAGSWRPPTRAGRRVRPHRGRFL